MKKSIALFITAFLAFGCVLTFSGCNVFTQKLQEDGYYTFRNFNDSYIEIVNLTEEGKRQKVLVLPTSINGIEVTDIADSNAFAYRILEWDSEALEKMYITKSYSFHASFEKCVNLKKIILPFCSAYPDRMASITKKYLPRSLYEKNHLTDDKAVPANVSFLWNYPDAENDGYYWIDDLDYGEKITLVPDEPIRRDFKFTGWYKEPECVNLWDFDSDTTPALQYDENENIIYQETFLYAGWR